MVGDPYVTESGTNRSTLLSEHVDFAALDVHCIICISVELRDPPLYEDIITNDVFEVQAMKDELDKSDRPARGERATYEQARFAALVDHNEAHPAAEPWL